MTDVDFWPLQLAEEVVRYSSMVHVEDRFTLRSYTHLSSLSWNCVLLDISFPRLLPILPVMCNLYIICMNKLHIIMSSSWRTSSISKNMLSWSSFSDSSGPSIIHDFHSVSYFYLAFFIYIMTSSLHAAQPLSYLLNFQSVLVSLSHMSELVTQPSYKLFYWIK